MKKDWGPGGLTGILLIGLEELGDLVTDLALGHGNIILEIAIVVHEREEAIVGDIDLTIRVKTWRLYRV